VVCLFGFLGYDYHRLQQRDKALSDEMVAIFKKTFPGVTKVQDPFVEMQARLKSAQGPASPTSLLFGNKRVIGLLAEVSKLIPVTVALRVSRLAIDRESVLIKGTTDTFNSVETIKSSLSGSAKFKSVQIVSATADKEKKNGAIRFEVQLQLEGI
jgi:general secretion pathway protein L